MDKLQGDILGAVDSARTRAGLEAGLRIHRVWEQALGKPLADELRVDRVDAGTLTVVTRSSVWLSEARFLTSRILEALKRVDPELPIERVEFKLDRSPPGPARPADERPVTRALDAAERERIQALVEPVRDPQLREGLTRLFEKAAARRPAGPAGKTGP